jgi:hypothetical protein
MSVQRHEYGAKGGVFRDPMTWTKNAEGTYHIVITTRRTGTQGQVLTYEYDWPSIPVSHTLAVATAERLWKAEHPQQRNRPQAADARKALVGLIAILAVVGIIWGVYTVTRPSAASQEHKACGTFWSWLGNQKDVGRLDAALSQAPDGELQVDLQALDFDAPRPGSFVVIASAAQVNADISLVEQACIRIQKRGHQ